MTISQRMSIFLFASITMEYAGAQVWTQLTPTGGPSARYEAGGVYDTATNQMIIFGGVASSGDQNDVWSLSLGAMPQWTLVAPSGSLPAPRVGGATVYDSANSRMMMFGGGLGNTSPCTNDVWVLSNANGVGGTPTWNPLIPGGPAPAGRWVDSVVYDPTSNRMIVYGGNNCFSGFYGDVWVLSNANGLGGAPAWTQLSPAGTPPAARGYHSAIYDPVTNNMTVFAGAIPPVGCVLNDVWLLSNANGLGGTPTWTQLAPGGATPPDKCNHSAVYDPASNRMTVFGGNGNTSGLTNDVWVMTNANGVGGTPMWSQLTPSGMPPTPRDGMPTVYDPATNRMIFSGGLTVDSGGSEVLLNDVWVLSKANGIGYGVCLLYDPTKAAKSGSTIPIKLELCDGSGNDLSSSTLTLHAVSVTMVSTSISGAVEDSGNANPGDDFRYDSTLGTSGGYIFNLSTKGMSTGSYVVNFTVTGDSTTYTAAFQVK